MCVCVCASARPPGSRIPRPLATAVLHTSRPLVFTRGIARETQSPTQQGLGRSKRPVGLKETGESGIYEGSNTHCPGFRPCDAASGPVGSSKPIFRTTAPTDATCASISHRIPAPSFFHPLVLPHTRPRPSLVPSLPAEDLGLVPQTIGLQGKADAASPAFRMSFGLSGCRRLATQRRKASARRRNAGPRQVATSTRNRRDRSNG